MPTIKDIAKLAGVSHGTVSNVLNQRGNVSVARINAVKAAAEKLGYKANAQAKSLRAGTSNSIALVVPDLDAERYQKLYSGMSKFLQEQGYLLELFLTQDREEIEKQQLEILASRQCQAVAVVSCLNDASLYYKKLAIDTEKIIFVYRDPKNGKHHCDIDMKGAAEKISKSIISKNYKNIGIFTDELKHSNTAIFHQTLANELKDCHLHYISAPDNKCHKAAFNFFSDQSLDAIICSDSDKVRHVRNACYLGSRHSCPPVYTLVDGEMCYEPELYCYSVHYQALGKEISQQLIGNQNTSTAIQAVKAEEQLLFHRPVNLPEEQTTLTLLTIDSPSTNALENILPHFYRMTGIEVKIVRSPFDQLMDVAAELQQFPQYDLIRIDMAISPWLTEKAFFPLNQLSSDLPALLKNFPDSIIKRYSKIGETAYAVPFDPSMQMLFFRRDLFEDQKIKRLYFEKFREQLIVPDNFSLFDRISAFFSDLQQRGEIKAMGSSATIGGTEMVATEFLLRYYAQGGKLLHKNSLPCLTPDIAEPTLVAYMSSLSHSQRLKSNWWNESVACFERGELAMLIVYMNLFSDVAHSEISPLTGFASVPGSKPLLGGGSIGISKFSRSPVQAAHFLQWLLSSPITEQMALLGGNLASESLYRNIRITDRYPWLELAKQGSTSGIRESYTSEGYAYNLHQAEIIIGQHIIDVINGSLTVHNAIDKINETLQKMHQQTENKNEASR